MRKAVLAFAFSALLLAAIAVPLMAGGAPAFAVPAHVHTPNHCQDLANGKLTHGVHVAHEKADVVIPLLCGH